MSADSCTQFTLQQVCWLCAKIQAMPSIPFSNGLQMMARRRNWLTSIKSWQEEFLGTLSAQEFVTCVTHDLLVSRLVFVFTPSGDLMRMPKVSFLRALAGWALRF